MEFNAGEHRHFDHGYPPLSFTYDGPSCLMLGGCQNIGHRTGMTDGAGSESWADNVVRSYGSVHQDQRTNNTSTGTINMTTTYALDFSGNVVQMIYPTGRTVSYTYDTADRPSTAADASNGIIYATDWQAPPAGTSCLPGEVCYTPQGSIYAMSVGQSCSFSGFNIQESYNSRLQPNDIQASSSAGSAIDISYSFVDPATNKNAGHVNSITNNLNSARSQTFTYDQVNRISSAETSSTTGTYCWGYNYSYDGAWGNLTGMSRASGYGSCNGTILAVASNGNNQIVGFTYDGAGNTTNDGSYTYIWDGESQLASAAGVNYSYDGDGRRVAKVGSKFYWYGSGDEILAETDDSGNTLNEYVFFGGRRVAVLPSTGGPLYYGSDMLGTSRVMVEANGTLCYDADFTPFGAEVPYTSNCSQNYKFEGKERDTETANDYFGARYYSSHFGRWLSADWSSVPAPVPYANLTNPQTLNLYSMVSDDPESFADLDGHENTTPAWERSDGQPNSCKGPTPDDCGAGTTQPNPQAQQTTTPASTTMPFPTTIELPDVGKILTTALSAAADTHCRQRLWNQWELRLTWLVQVPAG